MASSLTNRGARSAQPQRVASHGAPNTIGEYAADGNYGAANLDGGCWCVVFVVSSGEVPCITTDL